MAHWTVALEGGPRRVNHASARVDDQIYSFGGFCSIEEFNNSDSIQAHVLDTATLRWSLVTFADSEFVPLHRYGHTVVAVDNKIYLWGGRNDQIAFNELSCLNTSNLEWSIVSVSGSVPLAKDGHSACVIDNKMYIFGGFEFLTDQYSQDVHCLDLSTFEWQFVPNWGDAPEERDFHTAVGVGRDMYVFGGRGEARSDAPYSLDEETYCCNVYRFNTQSREWLACNPNGDVPLGRRSHSAWLYNGDMYIFGGYNGVTNKHFNDLYRYSPKKNKWQLIEAVGPAPRERRRQSCIMYHDKMYLFGGTSPRELSANQHHNETTMENSDLHVLDFAPTLRTLSTLAVLANKLDWRELPAHIKSDIISITKLNNISLDNWNLKCESEHLNFII